MQPDRANILKHCPPSVLLLAVSKQQSIDAMIDLYHQGQRAFGENYLQEALVKIEALKHLDIEWHFIGHIQGNKTKKIAEHFAWVQSVDSERIAKRLNEARPANLPPLNICIEVNIDDEANKAGVTLEALPALAKACLALPNLRLRGLMAIPKVSDNPLEKKQAFLALRTAFDTLNTQGFSLDTLSMGMSADYPLAIECGSTLIRLGTALFNQARQ